MGAKPKVKVGAVLDGEIVEGAKAAEEERVPVESIQLRVRNVLTGPVEMLVAQADKIAIRSDADQERGTELMGRIKGQMDSLDEERKRHKRPWAAVADAIDNLYMPHVKALAAALRVVKDRWGAYVDAETAKRERALEEQRERERKAAERAEATGQPVRIVPREAPPQVARTVGTSSGKASSRRVAVITLTDPGKCFAAYPNLFEFSEGKAQKLVAAGVHDIPGVSVEWKTDVSVGAR